MFSVWTPKLLIAAFQQLLELSSGFEKVRSSRVEARLQPQGFLELSDRLRHPSQSRKCYAHVVVKIGRVGRGSESKRGFILGDRFLQAADGVKHACHVSVGEGVVRSES